MSRRLRSRRSAIVAACAALAVAAVLTGFAASANLFSGSASAGLPPELVALEQKMEGLKLSSVRVSFQEVVSAPAAHGSRGRGRRLSGSHGVVEAGFKPHVARLSYTLQGRHASGRLVDGILYLGMRWLARMDGGRPWVATHQPEPPPEHMNLGPKLLHAGGPTFALMRKALAHAVSVREDGTATVDGRRALHFTATFKATGRLGFPGIPAHIHETGTLQLFIAPNGMPIRTVGTVRNIMAVTRTVSDLRGVDFPLAVKAPPAKLTIGNRALKRIERRQTKRRDRRIRRCLNRMNHAKHPRAFRKRFGPCVPARHDKHASGSPKIFVIKG